MAKNITLMGASYSNVPAVQLPQTGGGTARFDDTSDANATASDITTGKTAYVNGVKITGTNSGGGGASNYVQGTFTTNSVDGAQTITIPYTGNGYPICAMIFVKGGANNPNDGGWYNAVRIHAIGQWTMSKCVQSLVPTYTSYGNENGSIVTTIYKNSTSTASSYTRGSTMNATIFSNTGATTSSGYCVKFLSKTTMSVNVVVTSTSSSTYGLLGGIEYEYHIVYSE